MMRVSPLLVLACASLALSGCGGEAEGDATPGEVSADSSPLVVVLDSAPPPVLVDPGDADAPPGPETWTVRADGIGPIRVGMPVGRALGRPASSPAEPIEGCTFVYSSAAPEGTALMVVDDTVARVDVESGATATAAGVRIGDPVEAVRRAYGSVEARPHEYVRGEYLVVRPPGADARHRIVFETDGRRVMRFRAGRLPEVQWVEGCS